MELILSETKAISKDSPAVFYVKDNIEGDMTFSFILVDKPEDEGRSYTRYDVIDSHTGEFRISNVPSNRGVSLSQQMKVGTYQNDKKLYMSFTITKEMENGYHNITVEFFTKKEEE